MGIERSRNEDWCVNLFKIDSITEINESTKRRIKNNKYISILSNNIESLSDKVKLLLDNNVDLTDKVFAIDVVHGSYLTYEQCKEIEKNKTLLEEMGATFKVKDGNYWNLEEVSSVATQLDEVVNKIKSATVEENGKNRPLNELEKFLWAYSYVANRKYNKNNIDLDSPRKITSIMTTGDCVCVGFATILKELCSKLDIECYMNSCQVNDKIRNVQEGHCNNVVVIGETAYYCDACWDCLTEGRRPRRTFSNCLIPFDDRKDSISTSISELTSPYADVAGDLEDIKNNLNRILSMDTLSETEFKEFVSQGIHNRLSRYWNLIPQYQYKGADYFMNRNYKEEAVYYYSEAIKLIEKKQIKQPLKIEDFEKALMNIYKSIGNSEEKALEKTKADIDASIAEAGLCYYDTSKNCFAKEYYKQLEV